MLYTLHLQDSTREAKYSVPCIPDYQSSVAPTLHPFHHPSRPASWHLDRECARACPSPLVSCHPDRRCSHVHPNHLASSHQDPTPVDLCRLTVKHCLDMQYALRILTTGTLEDSQSQPYISVVS